MNLKEYIFEQQYFKVEEIIKNDINSLNIRDGDQNTPLHFAVNSQNIDIVMLILKHGKYLINAANALGNTPLMIAVKEGNLEITEILLNNYANIHQENFDNKTTIHFAAINNNLEMMELLKTYNANMRYLDSEGYNILHHAIPVAINDQDLDLVTKLIWNFSLADLLELPNNKGTTPLDIIINDSKGGTELLNLLLAEPEENNCIGNIDLINDFN